MHISVISVMIWIINVFHFIGVREVNYKSHWIFFII